MSPYDLARDTRHALLCLILLFTRHNLEFTVTHTLQSDWYLPRFVNVNAETGKTPPHMRQGLIPSTVLLFLPTILARAQPQWRPPLR